MTKPAKERKEVMAAPHTVDIRPGVSVLGVLRHLNYRPWFALGEFVDNSVQSFLQHRKELEAVEGSDLKLKIDIDVDTRSSARISIRDNAAGIFPLEFPRAFRPAALPPDRNGLAEFGMGMKSAACWFAPIWSVRTSALEDPKVRTVYFNIENIIHDDIHELKIDEKPEKQERHYTQVMLDDVFHVPAGRTVAKLKEHLTDIYRGFIREGWLDLRFNGESLTYSDPKVLETPYFKDKEGKSILWEKSITFDFGNGLSVKGFAAIRETANTAKAGFSLFRRGRVIQGSGDEGYRPSYIFGSSNSYRYQRLFGELHLEGFDVSHTKDGFRWDDSEQPFLELLHEHLDSDDMPLLRQAEGYRVRAPRSQLVTAAVQAVNNATQAMAQELPNVLPIIAEAELIDTPTEELPEQPTLAKRQFKIEFRERVWLINVEITNDPSENQWLVVTDSGQIADQIRNIDIRLSMTHPFMVRFAQGNTEDLEAILRIAAAIALSEVLARDAGIRKAGTFRRNINDILENALSDG